jgi:tetratricopeptide (TPR) repeat protein
VLGSAALLAAISIGCIRARRGRPYLLFGWAFYLGALVPVIGVVPVGAQAYADRYTYLPLVGIYCAVVWALGDAVFGRPTVRTPVVVLASCVLCLLAVRAFYQVGVWESSTKLYRHGLQVTDPNPILRNNLGIALTDGGNYEEAVQVYEHGLRAPSKFHHILNYNLGMAHANFGRHAEAVRAFDRALRIDREYEEALYHKGRSLKTLGDLEGAQLALEHAAQLAPGEPDVLYELGLVLGRLGQTAEARSRFSQVLVLRPGHVDARINLAVAHLKTGDAQSAIEQLNRVLQADPQHDAAHHYLELAKARLPAEDRN